MSPRKPRVVKTNITIALDPEAWHAFRIACMVQKTTASKEIGRFIREALAARTTHPAKETDHA